MSNKLSNGNRRKFFIISFIVLPILFAIGYYLCTKLAVTLGFYVDRQGLIFVALVLFALYLKSIHTAYKASLGNKK